MNKPKANAIIWGEKKMNNNNKKLPIKKHETQRSQLNLANL